MCYFFIYLSFIRNELSLMHKKFQFHIKFVLFILALPYQTSFEDVMSHYKDWVRYGTNVVVDETPHSQL